MKGGEKEVAGQKRDSLACMGREEKTNMSLLKLHHVGFTCEGRQSHQSRKWSERKRKEGVGRFEEQKQWMDGKGMEPLKKNDVSISRDKVKGCWT